MKNDYYSIVLLMVLFTAKGLFAQEIYNADFSNNGDGFADHTTSNPPAAGPISIGPFGATTNQWFVSYSTTPATDGTTNSFKVNDGALISDDWGGQGIFTSQSIDISAISVISISAIGTNIGANDDSFTYFYILDGGTRVETTVESTVNGDPVNYNIYNLDVATNNTIQVGFEFNENGDGNGYSIASFTVSETANPSVGFDAASSSENETNTTFNKLIPITFSNYSSDVTIGISVNGSSTAETNDYTLNTSSLTFTGNGTQNVSLAIHSDTDFESETIVLDITVTSGTANITIQQHSITIYDDDIPIVINEINADPDANNGDANGDGTVNTSQDEFVEIYNSSGIDIDLSNWVLADAVSDRHRFANGTILPANEAIVVFGGGNPITIPGLVQVASSGLLGLNNGGDAVIIKNNSGSIILTETYSSSAGNNQSIARNDDLTGSFVQHSTITSNPVLFSPGRDNTNNTPFSSTVKWTGITDSNWETATNWIDNTLPLTTSDIVIPNNVTNYPTASSAITFNSLTIHSGASFLPQSTVTGTVTYKRNLPTTNWYLVSSPASGETMEDMITNHTLASGAGGNLGLAPYSNITGPAWLYVQSGSTGILDKGRGYSVKFATPGELSFTGTANTTNVSIAVNTGDRTNYNLLGNPYTAYINSASFTSANTSLLTSETIWLWDGTQYITKNAADPIEIAPGQAFFVEAAASNSVTFSSANQSHQNADTFMRQEPNPSIELFVDNNDIKRATKVFYISGKTTGYDKSYDSKMFGEDSSKLAVFTELLTDNKGEQLAIQTLPNTNFESMVIPVGIKAKSGEEVTFSVHTKNLPENLQVYLEDRSNNVFTNLSEETYTVTPTNNTGNLGQFYLHTSAKQPTGNVAPSLQNISMYSTTTNEITIVGLQVNAKVRIYSVLGKEVLHTTVNSNGVSTISLPKLATGVYIVKLNSILGEVSKKVILK
ncbi:lamin tail domain-containing protein [Tenacibaculum tangerinum]|uniref:Lamin tail domain-containing protein n=1 Tax=Tenacibaculum tangerinum TaxID=3038772 RepID=A0ABY8L2U3_9FLAO|nr:lamin tail domain-containing protein [Tenacibaculum tangerinum]WGH75406.1 lamin tail domain-containing protein [Tenacibaculum tangerinum]